MPDPITRKHDPRFDAWHKQPRAMQLTRRDREIARADQAYAEELRKRTEPARINALLAGRGQFVSERPCPRCGEHVRRVFDRACWTCWQRKHRPPDVWQAIRNGGQYWGGKRSRAGHLAYLERQRRVRAGEFNTLTVGPFEAREHPDGRLEITAPPDLACTDLRAIHQSRLFQLAALHPELIEVMRLAGWSV